MIREEDEGFYYPQELKCQVCGVVLTEMDVFGETALEAAHAASLIRNDARCLLHNSHTSEQMIQEALEQLTDIFENLDDED